MNYYLTLPRTVNAFNDWGPGLVGPTQPGQGDVRSCDGRVAMALGYTRYSSFAEKVEY